MAAPAVRAVLGVMALAGVARGAPAATPASEPAPGAARQVERSSAARVGVTRIDVRGALDSRRLAHEVREALAAGASSDHIVLRLDADRWRLDVVWIIALAMRDSPAAVSVFLDDPGDGRVGLGPLLLAIIANRSMISPGTRVVSGPEENLRRLAPEETDWDRIEREVSGLLWVALEKRGLEPAIGEGLLRGRTSVWIIEPEAAGRGTPAISLEPPPERDAERIVDAAPDGRTKVEIPAPLADRLGLVDDRAASVRGVLRREGISRARIERTELASGLDEARRRSRGLLAAADRGIRRAERVLDRADDPPDERVVPRSVYHEAARRSRAHLAEAGRAIGSAESLFEAYPELLNTPAPEGTRVGRTRRRNASDWRWAFIDRRRDLERLEERAQEFAAR